MAPADDGDNGDDSDDWSDSDADLHVPQFCAQTFMQSFSRGHAPGSGECLTASKVCTHGRLGDAKWEAPRLTRRALGAGREGYGTRLLAHEYLDSPEVLRAKVKLLARLLYCSTATSAFCGAGISTSAGIRDYASNASSSLAAAAACASSGHGGGSTKPKPTRAHVVLANLARAVPRPLVHSCVTQNHDGLEKAAGFPVASVVEIHGVKGSVSNPVLGMLEARRPDLLARVDDWAAEADLALALGTSLSGMRADRLALEVARKARDAQICAGHSSSAGQTPPAAAAGGPPAAATAQASPPPVGSDRLQESLCRDDPTHCSNRPVSSGPLGLVIINIQRTKADHLASLRIFALLDDAMEMLEKEVEAIRAADVH